MNSPAEIEVRLVSAADFDDWDAFVDGHPDGTVEHLVFWRDVFRDVFHQSPVYLLGRRSGQAVGVLPLVLVPSLFMGRRAVSMPYTSYGGMLATDDSVARALADAARLAALKYGATSVELRNCRRYFSDSQCREHKVGARLSLPESSATLWGALDRKVRNLVRKPQRDGLHVDRGGAELLNDFYRVFAENMRDLGTPVFPRELFARAMTGASRPSIYVVRHGTEPIAASVTLGHKDRVLVPWASALRRYRHLAPNMLLYWTMLEAAIGDGYKIFDFGRSTRGGGTHLFKLQWGASDFPLYWETVSADGSASSDTDNSSSKRDAFVSVWQRLPLSLANAAGPFVIRHVV